MENYRVTMHPSFMFNSKMQRVPNYQQQSGQQQPIYSIGSYAGYPVSISHPSMYPMSHPFQRTFASVVGCENQNFNRHSQYHMDNTSVMHDNCSSGGLLNSFFKRFTNQNKPQPPPPHPPSSTAKAHHQQQSAFYQKEFEDYSHMPSVIKNPQTHPQNYNCYHLPTPGNLETKIPIISGPFYPPYPQNIAHNNMKGPNGYASFYEKPHNQNQQQQRWYNRSFKGFRCNRNNNHNNKSRTHHNPRFHHHDASNPKHAHEKERQSIERDIRSDFCDISNVVANKNDARDVVNDQLTTSETAKTSNNNCDRTACNTENNPPFEIYSLEEFPAIVSTTTTKDSPQKKKKVSDTEPADIDEGDFVMLRNDAHVTTPSFVPRRFTFCEKVTKLVKSPQKLLATPRRSCLKPTRRSRSLSECSDDFIVFEYASCDTDHNNDIIDTDSEDDSNEEESDDESEMSEDTVIGDESMELDETENEENTILEQLPDSGNEEKKVHFNLTPTVHTIRAWDYAYRQARRGACWQQLARDRDRFKKRVADQEKTLNLILDREHRNRIYNERFAVEGQNS